MKLFEEVKLYEAMWDEQETDSKVKSNAIVTEAVSTTETVGFIDCSGSNIGLITTLNDIARKLGVSEYYYFTDHIATSAEELNSYSTNYTEICQYAKANPNKNIVVITDEDINYCPGGKELTQLANVKIERIENHLRLAESGCKGADCKKTSMAEAQAAKYEILYSDRHTEIVDEDTMNQLVDELESFTRDDVLQIHRIYSNGKLGKTIWTEEEGLF